MTVPAPDPPIFQPAGDAGAQMMRLAEALFPICRAKTGDGVRRSLALLEKRLPTDAGTWTVSEVPTGTPILDWEAPPEWNVRDAFLRDPEDPGAGRFIDFQACNLHVVSGSAPIDRRVPWSELKEHLRTAPERPHDVPFCLCEPGADWGLCVSQDQYDALAARGERIYEVRIDATVGPGSLTYAEFFLPPDAADAPDAPDVLADGEPGEVLVSTHICHPSVAHDGISGMAVAVELARAIAARPGRRYGYRFLFAPATVGAIAWLAANRDRLLSGGSDRVAAGLVLACCGDEGPFTLRRSRRGDAPVDRAAAHVFKHLDRPSELRDFVPFGYDQRQFCSPGFDLPIAGLTRTPNGEYPQYHTSADDLSSLSESGLEGTLQVCTRIFDVLEQNGTYLNEKPYGEPRLGPSGLYAAFGADPASAAAQRAVQWVLNLSDGRHTLLDVAERADLPFPAVARAATALRSHGFLALPPAASSLA